MDTYVQFRQHRNTISVGLISGIKVVCATICNNNNNTTNNSN